MRYNNIRTISLLIIVGALINIGVMFISGKNSEVETGPIEVNVPQPEIATEISRSEWTPVPVVTCVKNTRSDKKWIQSRYVVTLENGLVIGSENDVLQGDTTLCWINNFHKSRSNPKMDSLVFENPY